MIVTTTISGRATLGAILALSILAGACQKSSVAPGPSRTEPDITAADVRSRIYLVADDSMRGREAGAVGNFMMTSYVAREMARLGLEPGGDDGTFFQTVPMIRRFADSSSTLSVDGQSLKLFADFALLRPSSNLRFATVLPPSTLQTVYGGRVGDTTVSLSEEAVRGRLVVFDAPLSPSGVPTGTYSTPAAYSISRFPTAAAFAIAALDLVMPTAMTSLKGSGVGLSEAGVSPMKLPFGLIVTSAAAERMMGAPLASLTAGATGKPVATSVKFGERPVEAPARNVVAIVRGSDPALRGQYVAVGAHSDHIAPARTPVDHDSLRAYNRIMRPNGADGRVARTTGATPEEWAAIRATLDSLRRLRRARPDSIYNGADDDGSGSVAVLEIAESLAGSPLPRRSILLVWHTGEEAGLLGSAWFTDHTTVPHDSIVAQLNMDMVGRGTARDTPAGGPRNIQVIGSRRLSTDLGNVLDSVNAKSAQPYRIDYSFDAPRHIQNRYCRSDHYMYARTGIPIAYLSRGYHQDYHQVTDEPQYINYDGLARVSTFVRDVALALANRNDRVRVDKPRPNPLAPCQQ